MGSKDCLEYEQHDHLVKTLKKRGICITCHDLAAGEIFGKQGVIYEDELYKVVLELRPRVLGHTIVVYKPHCEDLSHLSEAEAGPLFNCVSR